MVVLENTASTRNGYLEKKSFKGIDFFHKTENYFELYTFESAHRDEVYRRVPTESHQLVKASMLDPEHRADEPHCETLRVKMVKQNGTY